MLFADIAMARRIESAECRLSSDIANAFKARGRDAFTRPVAGGAAVFTGSGTPFNKLIGAGFGEALLASDLEAAECAFADRGSPLRAEVSTLADPEVVSTLSRRGYVLIGFEDVLGARLDDVDVPDVTGVDVAIADARASRDWIDTIVTGFMTPDTQGIASTETFPRDVIEPLFDDMLDMAGYHHFTAHIGRPWRARADADRRRACATGGSGDAARVPSPRRADGAARNAPALGGRTGLRSRGRDDTARIEVAGECASARVRAAVHARGAGEDAVNAPDADARIARWLGALEARHLADLTFAEVSRALRALSSCYVERRSKLGSGAALDGAGKRAAFAMFYGPLHFLLVRHVVSSIGPLRGPRENGDRSRLRNRRRRRGVGCRDRGNADDPRRGPPSLGRAGS